MKPKRSQIDAGVKAWVRRVTLEGGVGNDPRQIPYHRFKAVIRPVVTDIVTAALNVKVKRAP